VIGYWGEGSFFLTNVGWLAIGRAFINCRLVDIHISGVMVSMLASDRVRPKTIKLVFAAGSKSKDWFTLNQDNVSEWSDTSTHRLLFQLASTIKILISLLV
jgi:hypothetical protein